jgi:hypothetical protein
VADAKKKNRECCYHWTVGDEDSVIRFQRELSEMMEEYEWNCGKYLRDVLVQSEVVYNPAEINRFSNKYNIEFDFTNDLNDELDMIFFSTLLNKELRLHDLPPGGTMEERRCRLRTHLMIEQRLQRIRDAIDRTQEGKDAALILIKQVVPCIMHTKNHVGEKIITVLMSIGAAAFQSERRSESLEQYAEQVQHIVQTTILGTLIRPKLWRFPLKDNKKEVCNL